VVADERRELPAAADASGLTELLNRATLIVSADRPLAP